MVTIDDTQKAVYTIPEAARLLRISVHAAYLAARNGTLPSVRIGGAVRVPRARLEEMLGIPSEVTVAKEVGPNGDTD